VTSSGLLLDTCAILWLFGGTELQERIIEEIQEQAELDRLFLSPISAWEIGMLAAKGRIALTTPIEKWVAQAFHHASVKLINLDPEILVSSSYLPNIKHGDPADRIIMATARNHNLAVVTRDRKILEYAEQGHLLALEC
jgi:PIN domain nuclease of toxin-antitoxin system